VKVKGSSLSRRSRDGRGLRTRNIRGALKEVPLRLEARSANLDPKRSSDLEGDGLVEWVGKSPVRKLLSGLSTETEAPSGVEVEVVGDEVSEGRPKQEGCRAGLFERQDLEGSKARAGRLGRRRCNQRF
jgi:hypothetical protein